MVLLESLPKRSPGDDSEERHIITGVTWEDYESLLADVGDSPSPRVAYLDGVMELVAPSRGHESRKTRMGNLLEIYFLETDTPYFPMGSTTLKNQYQRAGVEPDESYCIREDQEIPHLAIEVVITSGSINRSELYGRLGIREIWFQKKGRVGIYILREENSPELTATFGYEKVDRSEVLPDLDINLFQKCLQNPDPLTAAKEFRASLTENRSL